MLLGEERVPVRGYKVLMRSASMPYWLPWVHVRLNPLRMLHVHVHIWLILLLLWVEAVLSLLLSSVFSLFLYLSVYKRQGVVVVESLAVK
jgi:dolichol kinase